MSAARLIKRRIKSAKSIAQITKAMEMVAASKMRKAQEQALATRTYSEKLSQIIHAVAQNTDGSLHPLLRVPDAEKQLVIVVSSDRGLAGPLNTNLFRHIEEKSQNGEYEYMTVGRKAKEYVLKTGKTLVAEFASLPDRLTLSHVLPVSKLILDAFLGNEYKAVYISYMKFITTLSQQPVYYQLLPLSKDLLTETLEAVKIITEYTFEPSPKDVLDSLLPNYVETFIYQTLLDAKASEYSARMVAMKNASDNANDIMANLQLIFNKSRQASITKELLDITTATLSVSA